MYDNMFRIEFLSKSENESFARVAVAAFVSQLDPTIEEITDIKTAVSEAVTNAIIHGYENKAGMVRIEAYLKDNSVTIEIIDEGVGINNVEEAMQPLYTSRPDLERSGMGFTVMETFMDSLEVSSEKGKGTKVTMKKTFKSLS
jgi:stage II sporulation protein AB (anti-sigma F factor)